MLMINTFDVMRKFIFSVALAVSALFAQAQEVDAQSEITGVANTLNAKCPVNYNDGMTLASVAFGEGQIIFEYTITADLFNSISSLAGILHDSMVAELMSSPDKNIQKMLTECRALNVPIVQHFTDPEKRDFSVTITPEDLQ